MYSNDGKKNVFVFTSKHKHSQSLHRNMYRAHDYTLWLLWLASTSAIKVFNE